MAKLKITQEQYNKLLLHEQSNRLNLLTETTHEVILGISMLAGLKLSGQNKLNAQNYLKDEKTLKLIKSTLESEDMVKELVDKFEEKGMKNSKEFLSKHADKIITKFNEYSKKDKLDFLTKTNLKDLTN
jgi:hypothetical protein